VVKSERKYEIGGVGEGEGFRVSSMQLGVCRNQKTLIDS
jgi:hypothetical protein